ncbi:hypothetical protein KFE25_013396 [Diacronema lutheri]|uniref:Pectin acetylesterase n=3 Tax=Diacronema lutheri TaxID=2081491 RepID=A0A8J5XNC3_DIALT|nr:hypothetical protein KFE25_013396 [Diacronema lutheri]
MPPLGPAPLAPVPAVPEPEQELALYEPRHALVSADDGAYADLRPAEAGRGPHAAHRRRRRGRRWRTTVRRAGAGLALALVGLIAGLTVDRGGVLHRALAPGRTLWREDLDAPGAVCNDGSPGAFWLSEARPDALPAGGELSDNWLIMLQGGFQCYSNASCACRAGAAPDLMSSLGWPAWLNVEGVVHQLSGWNAVVVGYCSSDAWLGDDSYGPDGTRSDNASTAAPPALPYAPTGQPLRFGGRVILEATLRRLADVHGMGEARRVIIGGCSAGGRGALYNLDHACELARAHVREARERDTRRHGAPAPGVATADELRCGGLIDAGWWVDAAPLRTQRERGVPSFAEVARASYALYAPQLARAPPAAAGSAANGTGGVCGDCAWRALQPGGGGYAGGASDCLLGSACAARVRTPFFLAQSQFDSFALSLLLGEAPPRRTSADPADAGWAPGGTLARVAAAQRRASRDAWTGAFAPAAEPRAGLTGLFGSACYTHCLASSADWFRVSVGGRSAAEVFESWLESGNELALDECSDGLAGGIGCSSACPHVPIDNPCSCAAPAHARADVARRGVRGGGPRAPELDAEPGDETLCPRSLRPAPVDGSQK